MEQDDDYFDLKQLKFSFDLGDCKFEMDILQDKLLQFYLRTDRAFRRAFSTNFTEDFFSFVKSKTELGEALHLSTIGTIRGGKSVSMISICVFHQACYKKRFTIDYICGNSYEYLDKLKAMPKELLINRMFLVDEEKQGVFNVGSTARKLKLTDVQNIIGLNNISTILINPMSWANENAFYGLRAFGKCRKTGINRFMLYNLQAGSRGNMIPVGLVYIPIFTKFLPKEYGELLEKQYLEKKSNWVDQERMGKGDVLSEMRRKFAKEFVEDDNYLAIKKKGLKQTYIAQKLGSEFTRSEVEDIFNITQLLEQGISFEKEENSED